MSKHVSKNENKSAFIRSQGSELSAVQLVEKAKATGMVISPSLVYVVRSTARKKLASPVGPARGRRRSASTSKGATGRATQAFVNLVASLGLLRSEQLLSEFKRRLGSM